MKYSIEKDLFQFASSFYRESRSKSNDDIQAERLIKYAKTLKASGYSINNIYTILNQLAPNQRCAKQLSCNQSDM